MVASRAEHPEQYIAELPPERAAAISAVRDVILEHLPEGYEEQMAWGMLSYVIPLHRYPDTYNGEPLLYAALASQKNYMSLYLNGPYSDPDKLAEFQERYRATGKRLDMGKSCVRFTTLDQLPRDLVADEIASMTVDDYIGAFEASRT